MNFLAGKLYITIFTPTAVTLNGLLQTYDGAARIVTATTIPAGLTVNFTYNGSASSPQAAGSYAVVGTIVDGNYEGSISDTLVVTKATAIVTQGDLSQTYDGTGRSVSATTTPAGLTVDFTYNGNATAPTAAGSYAVVGTINDANYAGSASGILVVGKGSAAVTLGELSQIYDGTARVVTATTTPAGLTVAITYDGSSTAPTAAGTYAIVGTVDDQMYEGSATATLKVFNAAQSVDFVNIGDQITTNVVALTATASSGLSVTNFSIVSGPAVLDGSSVSFTNSGAVVLSAMQAGDSNFNASPATNIMFNVTKALATVTLGATDQVYNGAARVVTAATTPTGQTVELTYNGSSTAPVNAGSYIIVGTVNEAMYQGSTTATLTVAKANQSISVATLGQHEVTDTVELAATATSGFGVIFSTTAPGALSGGNTLSFSAAGRVSVLANQPGNANWNAAPTITNTVDVIGVIIDVTPNSGTVFGGTEVVISGLWLGNGSDVTNVTLCGVAATLVTQTIYSVTISSGATNSAVEVTGDVTLSSGFGTMVLANAYTYRPVPLAPEALSAIGITSSQFTARWTNLDQTTTHYFVDVSESTNFTTCVEGYSNWSVGNATAGLVTGLRDGVTYWYRVRAANVHGSSLNSNIIKVPVSANTPYTRYEVTDGIVSAGSSDVVDLTKLFHGTGMRYSIVSNSNPALVTATLNGNKLILDYAAGASGVASITVRVTDLSNGFSVDTTLTFNVLPAPGKTLGPITLNPQNGLFEQKVTVFNNSPTLAAKAVTLTVVNLTTGATLYNATGTDQHGNPEILWIGTLAPLASLEFTLQYYTPKRGVIPSGTVIASLSLEDPRTAVSGNKLQINGAPQTLGGTQSFLIEFNATPGRTYYVQYTDSLARPWRTVQPAIVAPVNRIQWIDSGPPGTECPPGEAASRFYRIIETQEGNR